MQTCPGTVRLGGFCWGRNSADSWQGAGTQGGACKEALGVGCGHTASKKDQLGFFFSKNLEVASSLGRRAEVQPRGLERPHVEIHQVSGLVEQRRSEGEVPGALSLANWEDGREVKSNIEEEREKASKVEGRGACFGAHQFRGVNNEAIRAVGSASLRLGKEIRRSGVDVEIIHKKNQIFKEENVETKESQGQNLVEYISGGNFL